MGSTDVRSILLVEDNPDDRGRVHRLLRGHRREYHVVDCATGEEALALLRTGTRFDCVLLDHYLPDMTGDELLGRLRAPNGRLPVAVSMLTGHDDDAAAARALELGAEDFLLKDALTPHALGRSIENVKEKFEIRQQLEGQRAAVELRNQRLEGLRAELEERLAELHEATQSRDRFVAMMSHEMRTPLNAILGYAELLELEVEGQLNEAQRRNLDRIRVGSRHLLDLINDVLDLARADARKLELDLHAVDVNAAVEEVSALLENEAAQKGLALVHHLAPGLPLASADLQRLRQVLTNLVGNAVKFTLEGGITVTTREAGGRVVVEVADTGMGIDEHSVGDVFKEFYQADNGLTRTHGGSGLGLAISQRLARAMGGEIGVRSRRGEGSVFTLTLPAAQAGSAVRPEDLARHDARMARHRELAPGAAIAPVPVVAFADDAGALAALERQVSHSVALAWTTKADEVPALAAAREASLVILDVSSREDAAWRVAHAVADMPAAVPPAILLLPGIIARGEGAPPAASAVDLGWVALVPKPFTSEQLTRAVSAAAGRTEDDPSAGDGGAGAGGEAAGGYEVLVIDDDMDSRRVASRFLRERGIRVRECADGESGLVEMRLRPPDVAVLDLMMPVLDGFGVLATMRADPLLASIPVVVLTAKTLTDGERQFLARTAVRVLQKGEHRLSDVAALVLRAAERARLAAPPPTPAP
ncbi:MAG TPA: response regulator [Gemmatimonadaceae bacterium]